MLARFNQKTTGRHMHLPESSGMPMFPGDACRVPSAGAMLSIVLFDRRCCDEPLSALPARRHA
jgi:hypothetical protein